MISVSTGCGSRERSSANSCRAGAVRVGNQSAHTGRRFVHRHGHLALIPDKIEEEEAQVAKRFGVFGATLISFFLANMGDKTQIAKGAMAAHCANPIWVVIGTALGILLADVPAVLVGHELAGRIPMKQVHSIAAGVCVVLGVAILLCAAAGFGI